MQLEDQVNEIVADQYLNHKTEFADWMNSFMEKRPLQQRPREEDSE